jgi:hypothetical protein
MTNLLIAQPRVQISQGHHMPQAKEGSKTDGALESLKVGTYLRLARILRIASAEIFCPPDPRTSAI